MLENYWYVAAESKEVKKRPISAKVFGKPLVIFRDQSGESVVLDDRCAHRNAPLSLGKIVDGTVQCPYHGWCYGSDGNVCRIPSLDNGCPSQKSIRISSYPCKEQDGYIWVSLSENPATPAPIPFAHINEKGWTNIRMKTRFHADVESCLENFLDCPHAAFVHRGWFRTHSKKEVSAELRTLEDGVEVEYFGESRRKSAVYSLVSRRKSTMRHVDRFIAPQTSRVDYIWNDGRQAIITSSCTPISEHQTEVYTVLTFKFGMFTKIIKLLFASMARKIIRQDVDILNAAQKNIDAFGGKASFRYIATDMLRPEIIQWRNALSKRQSPPKEGRRSRVELQI